MSNPSFLQRLLADGINFGVVALGVVFFFARVEKCERIEHVQKQDDFDGRIVDFFREHKDCIMGHRLAPRWGRYDDYRRR